MRYFVATTKYLRGRLNPLTVWAGGFRLFINKLKKETEPTVRSIICHTDNGKVFKARASAHDQKGGMPLSVKFKSVVE